MTGGVLLIPTNGNFFSKPGATRHSNAFRAQPLHVANKNIPGPFSLLGAPLRMSEFTVLTSRGGGRARSLYATPPSPPPPPGF